MNVTVTGVTLTPPPVPAAISPPEPGSAGAEARPRSRDSAAANAARRAEEAKQQAAREAQAEKVPPLKALTTTEVRVILGALPVSAINKPPKSGVLDVYA